MAFIKGGVTVGIKKTKNLPVFAYDLQKPYYMRINQF